MHTKVAASKSSDIFFNKFWLWMLMAALCLLAGTALAQEAAPEPYEEAWSFEMEPWAHLRVNLTVVDLMLEAYEGETLEIAFVGTRIPAEDGQLPEMTAHSEEAGVFVIAEVYPQQVKLPLFGMGSSGELSGTLHVRVPRSMVLSELTATSASGSIRLVGVNVSALYASAASGDMALESSRVQYGAALETFSGAVTALDVEAESLYLSSSSGAVAVDEVAVLEVCAVETFSGEQRLCAVSARALELETASGNVSLEDAWAETLWVKSFSGALDVRGLTILGEARVETASGAVTLSDLTATRLETEQFTGDLTMDNVVLSEQAVLTTSGGAVEIDFLVADGIEVETFTGDIRLTELKVERIRLETSTGTCLLALGQGADVAIKTFSGDVELILPAACTFDYVIDTFSGQVDFDLSGAYDRSLSGAIVGQVGEGGHRVLIDTTSGFIQIHTADEMP